MYSQVARPVPGRTRDPTLFVVQAHSFGQQSRLAITLAWIAGYTNILTILTCGHVTSHVSGTTSDLGRFLVERKWEMAFFGSFLLTTFFVGAAISGFATELGKRRRWESIYVLPMAIEALLLAALALMLEFGSNPAAGPPTKIYSITGLASIAMGLQNATITRISSGVVRTTHVTGVLTDLGLELAIFASWLIDVTLGRGTGKGSTVEKESVSFFVRIRSHAAAVRLALLASILGSFGLGAALGTVAFEAMPRFAMFPPVLFLLWIVFQDIVKPIAVIEPSDTVTELGASGIDPRLGIYRLRHDSRRKGRVQRMPSLRAWVDALPPSITVAVLDMHGVQQIDDNTALELRTVLEHMHDQGRHLVLSGITPAQFRCLSKLLHSSLLSPRNACTDLELAIARGLNLLPPATNTALNG